MAEAGDTAAALSFMAYYIFAGAIGALGATAVYAAIHILTNRYTRWRKWIEPQTTGRSMLRRPLLVQQLKPITWSSVLVRMSIMLTAVACFFAFVAVFQAL